MMSDGEQRGGLHDTGDDRASSDDLDTPAPPEDKQSSAADDQSPTAPAGDVDQAVVRRDTQAGDDQQGQAHSNETNETGGQSSGQSSGAHRQFHDAGGPPKRAGGSAALSGRRARQLAPASEMHPGPLRSNGYTADADPDEFPFDFQKYIAIAIKHRLLIAAVTTLTVALGLFYTLLQTPLYRGTATIEITRNANISGLLTVDPDAGRGMEFFQTHIELLKSRALAARVVANLGLAQNGTFLEGNRSGLAKLREVFLGTGRATGTAEIAANEEQAVRMVRSGVNVAPVRNSNLMSVSFDSPDPATAQRLANSIAESYVTINLERRMGASAEARRFLEERLQQVRLNLEDSEKALVAYAEERGIVPTGGGTDLSIEKITDIHSALRTAERELLRQQTLWQQVEGGAGGALLQRFENEAVEKLRAQRAELTAEYHQKLTIYKPEFPEMLHLRARIDEVARQISAESERIKESLRLQYEAALEEYNLLSERAEQLSKEIIDNRSRNVEYTFLQREVDTNRALYDGLLQRYKEIGVTGGVDQSTAANNVAVVDRAQRPAAPFEPDFKRNLLYSLILGLAFGGAGAFARELLDNTFKDPDEVERELRLPILGIVPKSDEVTNLQATIDDPQSALGEAYRSLRTTLQFSTSDGAPRTLLVTSTQPGEGKSTTALSIAYNFAKLGMRVLLIDADMRRPSLHHMLDCQQAPGLSNLLVGNTSPSAHFQRLNAFNLVFLPAGLLPPNPAELLSTTKLASLIAVASEKFDLVVVDGPPVAGLADAPLLASLTAGTLLVVEAHATHRKRVTAAVKRLDFARAELVGVVFNKFDATQAGYGIAYGYDSYYGYGASPEETSPEETSPEEASPEEASPEETSPKEIADGRGA